MKRLILTLAALATMVSAIAAQTNDFTYQGTLNLSGSPANGSYDFEFRLFDAENGGVQVSSTATRTGVSVADGRFTVSLAFAGGFPGADRWLEIWVRPAGAGGYQQLLPRVKMGSSPYAVKSQSAETAANATNATTANNALNLGGVAANQYVQTTDPRMADARPPTAGSTNYVQNQNAGPQAGANFNIAGTGSAGILNAATQFNLGGSRILSAPSATNTFGGIGAGTAVTTGTGLTFFGANAGAANTTANSNSFFGSNAGAGNTTGYQNSFFGRDVGLVNTTGHSNSAFGYNSALSLTTGFANSFVGSNSGRGTTTGSSNTFFGSNAGYLNEFGTSNTIVGSWAGFNTRGSNNTYVGAGTGEFAVTGEFNTFLGNVSGRGQSTGSNNTLVGAASDVAANGLTYATAIGSGAEASLSNSIYLGRSGGQDTVRIPGNLNLTGAASINGNLVVSSGNLAVFNGNVVIPNLGTAGATSLCRNTSNILATCSSSLRYKTNINPFTSGLDLIRRLQPITFDWKEGGLNDLGLGAEDVAAIEPLLVTYNKDGQVEGVKYDRIGVVLVNAVKEQQRQIDDQRKEIQALRSALCSLSPQLAICNSQENKK